jgi:hypothetical protein
MEFLACFPCVYVWIFGARCLVVVFRKLDQVRDGNSREMQEMISEGLGEERDEGGITLGRRGVNRLQIRERTFVGMSSRWI